MRGTFTIHSATETSCEECHVIHRNLKSDDYGDTHCPDCGDRLLEQSRVRAEWITIAIFETCRQYGGPEEGGWWYESGSLVNGTQRSFLPEDAPVATQYEELCWNRADAYSQQNRKWANETCYTVRVFVEQDADGHFPLTRPFYH